ASGNVFLYDGCTEIASTGLTPIDVTAMGLNNLFDAYVGASNAAGSNSFNGDIAEVIIYNEVLTPSDRVAVTKYLNTRWNLSYNTGSCPTTINCLANQDPVGATCSTNSTCCSGECVSGKCCVRVGYLGKGQACTKNSDCCDGRAVCTGYGFCWIPPLN
ncbi:MAG: hypothetical protein EB060_05315, partial [Proteobacteria bacterium]|nr:hypothetical protein [Pseudomonadota bacterium]